MNSSTIIKQRLVEMGAAQYVAVVPFIEELLHEKIGEKTRKLEAVVEEKTRKLEVAVKKLVTDEVFQEAVLLHARQQKNKLNPKKELHHDPAQQ